jgi:hypothetical protein
MRKKALRLGLSADDSFEDNVRYYIEDDRPLIIWEIRHANDPIAHVNGLGA